MLPREGRSTPLISGKLPRMRTTLSPSASRHQRDSQPGRPRRGGAGLEGAGWGGGRGRVGESGANRELLPPVLLQTAPATGNRKYRAVRSAPARAIWCVAVGATSFGHAACADGGSGTWTVGATACLLRSRARGCARVRAPVRVCASVYVYVRVRARGLSPTRKMHEVHAGASVCARASVVGVVAAWETACEPSGLLRPRLGAAFWRQVLPDEVRLPYASWWTHHDCLHPHLQPRHEHGYIMRGPGGLCQLHRSVATRPAIVSTHITHIEQFAATAQAVGSSSRRRRNKGRAF